MLQQPPLFAFHLFFQKGCRACPFLNQKKSISVHVTYLVLPTLLVFLNIIFLNSWEYIYIYVYTQWNDNVHPRLPFLTPFRPPQHGFFQASCLFRPDNLLSSIGAVYMCRGKSSSPRGTGNAPMAVHSFSFGEVPFCSGKQSTLTCITGLSSEIRDWALSNNGPSFLTSLPLITLRLAKCGRGGSKNVGHGGCREVLWHANSWA